MAGVFRKSRLPRQRQRRRIVWATFPGYSPVQIKLFRNRRRSRWLFFRKRGQPRQYDRRFVWATFPGGSSLQVKSFRNRRKNRWMFFRKQKLPRQCNRRFVLSSKNLLLDVELVVGMSGGIQREFTGGMQRF